MENILTRVFIGDDWEACYYNGELIEQGHSLNLSNICYKIGIRYESKTAVVTDIDNFDTPQNLNELQLK